MIFGEGTYPEKGGINGPVRCIAVQGLASFMVRAQFAAIAREVKNIHVFLKSLIWQVPATEVDASHRSTDDWQQVPRVRAVGSGEGSTDSTEDSPQPITPTEGEYTRYNEEGVEGVAKNCQ